MDNKGSGRERRVSEGGKGVHKRGDGLGTGPVGRKDGYSGRKSGVRPSGSGSSHGGGDGGERAMPVKQQTPTQRRRAAIEENVQKRTSEPIVEMATLVRKSDDRLRVIESTGQVRLVDEYYELIFVTRKGQKLKIECFL